MSKFIALGEDVPERGELKYEQLPFYHPLFILYSSGTTGKPKCIVSNNDIIQFYQFCVSVLKYIKDRITETQTLLIGVSNSLQVHGAGGTLMKHLEEHQIQGNRTDQDILMYYTTTGKFSRHSSNNVSSFRFLQIERFKM